MDDQFIQVVTTVASRDQARSIAERLVELRLAACVQIAGPIASVYRWKGDIELAEEWQCLAKGRRTDFAEMAAAIRGVHPYEIPEILAFAVIEGNEDYLRWLKAETARPVEP